ncbi:MAG: molybdenum cofactor biosynthesis protein [Candidatus Brockarchaeota archaeon]|nr:molybdenum cofactor biosynthesis protein [Candidatus Brockarchaeota archaeon]
MKPFGALMQYDEALALMLGNTKPIERREAVSIEESYSRVLAEDVVAGMDVPPFDRAAMDGYAVMAKDTYGAGNLAPVRLKIAGTVYAGEEPKEKVREGTCVRIATGAKMPIGADAVVMAESAEQVGGDEVDVFKPVYPGANVSPAGEDISKGQRVLGSGETLTPSKVGVLAALGIRRVAVYEKPRVAIVPTGAEVADVGEALGGGKVYDINSYTIGSVTEENGCVPVRFKVVPDSAGELKAAISKALDNDLVVLSGGSSVGERDLLFGALSELGTVLFHGVQVKPGKPTVCAKVREKLVVGMPGYPTSCLSNCYLFLVPVLRKLARLGERKQMAVKARASKRIVSTLGRMQFLTVKLEGGLAVPVYKESSAITSMSQAHGYIRIPANVETIEKGEEVEVYLF